MLVPLPVGAVSLVIVSEGENLRQYGMPWLLAITALLLAGLFSGVHAVQADPPRRAERAGYAFSIAALVLVAGFFAVLGAEDLVDDLFGTGRFLSSNGVVTAIGTLAGSVASLIVLPIGLCLFGLGTARAHVLPGRSRWLPLAIPIVVVTGAALASKASTSLVSLAWVWLVAAACLHLGTVLWRMGATVAASQPVVAARPATLVAVAGDHH
jgi:hypothetical protein